MRQLLLVLLLLCVLIWTAVGVLLTRQGTSDIGLPTLVVLASLTPTATWTASPTATPTVTPSPTLTPTKPPTDAPTPIPTPAERVRQIIAIMPGVAVTATPTDFPFGTRLLPAPPDPVEPLPDATRLPPPYDGWLDGWYSFESDHPAVQYATRWEPRQLAAASRGQYHRTEDVTSSVALTFTGDGLRVRYVAAPNMGVFEVVVDGTVLDTVDAYRPDLHFPGTPVYALRPGVHHLVLRASPERNPAATGQTLALDAVQVYRGSPHTLILTPVLAVTPAPTPQSVARIESLTAPDVTAAASPDAVPAGRVSLVIAYDENGNKAIDPAEGVRDIPVRLVDSTTNRVIAQSLTDAAGFVELDVPVTAPVRLVVPYFDRVWDLARSTGGSGTGGSGSARRRDIRLTLLLAPGNQPGLIP